MSEPEILGPQPEIETRRQPFFNIPLAIVAVVALMMAIHLVRFYLLTPDVEQELVFSTAFIPQRYLFPLGEQDLGWLWGPVTYSLLHGSWMHLIFNSVWLVVFASPLADRIGTGRFILLWVTSAVASAFFQAFVTDFADSYLIGASGVVSAAFGAACRFSVPLSGTPYLRLARIAPRLGILEALRNKSVISFILMWALSNALVVWGVGMPGTEANIAWQAHVGGFLFGYLTFGFFDRADRVLTV